MLNETNIDQILILLNTIEGAETVRIVTGFLTIIVLFFTFSFMLVQAVTEMDQVQSIDKIVEERVNVDNIHLATNSYMYNANGELISEIYQDENRIYLPYEQIPDIVIKAFLAVEDQRFFEHKGYDLAAIIRAILANAKSNSIEQGASTVTQQVVKNLFLTSEQTYDRKVTELFYAYQLEQHYSKEKIFELYFNSIYFHNGVYGFETASRFYFGKSSSELTLAQVALLSAIPNNPSYYDPIQNITNTHQRKNWILEKMLEAGYITAQQFETAKNEEISLQLSPKVDLYPDYVTYIHQELKDLVAEKEGFSQRLKETASEEERREITEQLEQFVSNLYQQGIHIHTHLNPVIQEKAIRAVEKHLPNPDLQGAAVVIDHENHAIVAITGGKNYKKFDFHRGFQAYRQPGSSIKPLLVYGPYIDQFGASTQSIVNANNLCIGNYCPKNFGGSQYGNVTIERAFIHSYNTPAVRLLNEVGIQTAFSYLEKFQFHKLEESDYRLPAALGGFKNGMTPLEMTNAYTTFANGGIWIPAKGIKKVTDSNGNVLYEWNEQPIPIWSQGTNEKLRKLLQKTVTNGTGRKAYVPGNFVGGKTGTTDDYKDIWFIGIYNNYTAGVWVGKDIPESLQAIYQSAPQQRIWREIFVN